MVAPVDLGDGNRVENARFVGRKLDVIGAQFGIGQLRNLFGVHGVDLRVALAINGRGLVFRLALAHEALDGRSFLRGAGNVRHGIGLPSGQPPAVYQEGRPIVGLEGHERLVRRARIDGTQAQQHLLVRQVVPGQRDAGPFLTVFRRAAIVDRAVNRHRIGIVSGFDLLVPRDNLVVFAQLPRGQDGKGEVGKNDYEQGEKYPVRA